MQDLERLFRHLTRTLYALDPGLVQQPVTVAELMTRYLPYRTSRRALAVESSEDYELLLLRLAAGEGGYVTTDPAPVRTRFGNEARSPNPDLGVLREFRDAVLILQPGPLARVLAGQDEDEAFAPPRPVPPPAPVAPPEPVEMVQVESAVEEADVVELLPFDAVRTPPEPPAPEPVAPGVAPLPTTQCSFCGGALPSGRMVHFCPHCGQSQTVGQCPRCKAEVEYGWRHCVSCGTSLNFDG